MLPYAQKFVLTIKKVTFFKKLYVFYRSKKCFLKCFPNVALFLVAFPLYPQTIVPILFKTEYWIFFWWDSEGPCTISYTPTRNSGETRELVIKLLKIVKSGGDAMKKKKRTSNSQSKVTDNTKEQSRPMLEANMANIDRRWKQS